MDFYEKTGKVCFWQSLKIFFAQVPVAELIVQGAKDGFATSDSPVQRVRRSWCDTGFDATSEKGRAISDNRFSTNNQTQAFIHLFNFNSRPQAFILFGLCNRFLWLQWLFCRGRVCINRIQRQSGGLREAEWPRVAS